MLTHSSFRHATLSASPAVVAGLTLTDEDDKGEFTGVYTRDADGGLFGARTVIRKPAEHHRSVIQAWINTTPGELQDLRAVKS